jgi:hypothetical protein
MQFDQPFGGGLVSDYPTYQALSEWNDSKVI